MADTPKRQTPTDRLVESNAKLVASEAARSAAETESRLYKERADKADVLTDKLVNLSDKVAHNMDTLANLARGNGKANNGHSTNINNGAQEGKMNTIAKTQLSTTDWFLRLLIAAVIVVAVAFAIIWGYHNISWTSPAVVGPIPNPTPAVLVDADPAPVLPAQPAVNYEEAGIVTNVVPPSSCQVANNVITVVGSNYSTATGQFYRPDCGESLATAEIAPTPPPRPAYLENIELASSTYIGGGVPQCPAGSVLIFDEVTRMQVCVHQSVEVSNGHPAYDRDVQCVLGESYTSRVEIPNGYRIVEQICVVGE